MFRNQDTTASSFITKFTQLRKKLSVTAIASLDLEYYKELEAYIDRLYSQLIASEKFDDAELDDIREAEMSNLNRLQKMKNGKSYKKAKHKLKGEDWE